MITNQRLTLDGTEYQAELGKVTLFGEREKVSAEIVFEDAGDGEAAVSCTLWGNVASWLIADADHLRQIADGFVQAADGLEQRT